MRLNKIERILLEQQKKGNLPIKFRDVLTENETEMGYELAFSPELRELRILHNKTGTVASIDLKKANADWVHNEIKRHQVEKGVLSVKTRKIVWTTRAIIFGACLYVLGLIFYGISPFQTGFTIENLFWTVIFLLWWVIPAGLYLTREEYMFKKHIKDIVFMIGWIFLLYLLCFTLNSMILGRLALPSLW
ncbi:MAG: hypothetical protein ACTSSJ_07955 [Candidatus Odinarchaeia archaeon]